MTRATRFSRWLDGVFAVAFLLAILLPLGRFILVGPDRRSILAEFRSPAPPPELEPTWDSIRAWPGAFSSYWADSFGGRTTLVRWHNRIKLLGLGVSPIPRLVVGRDHWLFLKDEQAVESHRGLGTFDEGVLDVWRRTLRDRREWLALRGIPYVFTVAPNKHSVYPEYLPDRFDRAGPTTLYDRWLDHVETKSGLRTLDLRPALLRAKSEQLIYYPFGSHWDQVGAFYAYREVAAAVGEHLPSVRPLDLADVDIVTATDDPGDSWARKLYVEDFFQQEVREVLPKGPKPWRVTPQVDRKSRTFPTVNADKTLPVAVVFHDSFGELWKPFLSRHFSRTVWVWTREFDAELVDRERPNVVIQEIVERFLIFEPQPLPPQFRRELRDARRRNRTREPAGAATVPAAAVAPLVGEYVNPHFGRLTIGFEEGHLKAAFGDVEAAVLPRPDGTFASGAAAGIVLAFTLADEKHLGSVVASIGAGVKDMIFVRRKTDSSPHELDGFYEGTDQQWHTLWIDDRPVLFGVGGRRIIQLESAGDGTFRDADHPKVAARYTPRADGVLQLVFQVEVEVALDRK